LQSCNATLSKLATMRVETAIEPTVPYPIRRWHGLRTRRASVPGEFPWPWPSPGAASGAAPRQHPPHDGGTPAPSQDDRVTERPPRTRVLLIEPSPALREITSRAFEREGYEVAAAAGLADAESLLRAFDPHVVITELSLPDGSGDAVCLRLKSHPTRMVPVVLVSGMAEIELARRARRVGADRHHCKSRGMGELTALVGALASEILF
jgi:CheY-like chemotaxis protein